jgi:hypothetical protein
MRTIAKLQVLGILSAFLVGCGGGSDGSGSSGTCANIAGTWDSSETVDGSACGEGTFTQQQTYTITQTGCAITIAVPGTTFTGTVSGSHLSWTGSFPSDGGTTTITGMNLTLASDQGSATGTASWTWSGSGTSCPGTTQVTATKRGGTSTGTGAEGAFCAKMVECGSGDQATCQPLAQIMLQGIVPDPDYFQTCVQGLQCSQLLDQTAVQGCVNLDEAATVCSGASLHACAQTGKCVDVSCATACGYLGLSYDHCAFDASKNHDVCYCG